MLLFLNPKPRRSNFIAAGRRVAILEPSKMRVIALSQPCKNPFPSPHRVWGLGFKV